MEKSVKIPSYTVVSTVYNDASEIESLIMNIKQQTLKPYEMIIVDGGSTDETKRIISRIQTELDDLRIVLLEGENLSIAAGLNQGIKLSNTEYIGIAAVGNEYADNFFELLMMHIIRENADIAYSPVLGKKANLFQKKYSEIFLCNEQNRRLASNHGALVKKVVYEELGYYCDDFVSTHSGEDTEFFLLARKRGYDSVIVRDAKLVWDVPRNYREFRDQIRNYTITDLQLFPESQVSFVKNCIVKTCLAGGVGLLFVILWIADIPRLISILFTMICFVLIIWKRDAFNSLVLVHNVVKTHWIVKNRCYLQPKYRVNRD